MNDWQSIVPEILRGANKVETLSPQIVANLLHRAVLAIRDLREEVGIPGTGTSGDAIIGLIEVASHASDVSFAERRAALLEAGDLLRTLRIVAESGIELRLQEA